MVRVVRMSDTDTYRDSEGFGRPVEVEHRVWSVKGPDNEDHAQGCMFIQRKGILPCSCDATRKEYMLWWYRWLRWQQARVSPANVERPIKWPVAGPNGSGEQWIPGIDFNDEPQP